MNVYDFDKTIFYPDSSFSFVGFCMKKYPRTVLGKVPGVIEMISEIKKGSADTKMMKEELFSFLSYIWDVDSEVRQFWDRSYKGIGEWYMKQRRADDLIISASPEFLVKPAATALGVSLIATDMNKHTGMITGKNCHGEEKVRRFYEQYPDGHVDEFYSDSLTDSPMARIADRAFIVKKHTLLPWPKEI